MILPPLRKGAVSVGAAILGLGLAVSAHASGRMPILVFPVTHESHGACVAALEASAAKDRAQTHPLTINAEGQRREVTLHSKGVERIDAQTALYDATLWFNHGRPSPSGEYIETSHSFIHRIQKCAGATLETSGEEGYTMNTYTPVESTEPVTSE